MSVKKSRYYNTPLFSGEKGTLPEFMGTRPRNIAKATGIIEYIVKEDDRLDLLSLYFYNDSYKWWRILDANPEIIFGADMGLSDFIGETILIPGASEPGGRR